MLLEFKKATNIIMESQPPAASIGLTWSSRLCVARKGVEGFSIAGGGTALAFDLIALFVTVSPLAKWCVTGLLALVAGVVSAYHEIGQEWAREAEVRQTAAERRQLIDLTRRTQMGVRKLDEKLRLWRDQQRLDRIRQHANDQHEEPHQQQQQQQRQHHHREPEQQPAVIDEEALMQEALAELSNSTTLLIQAVDAQSRPKSLIEALPIVPASVSAAEMSGAPPVSYARVNVEDDTELRREILLDELNDIIERQAPV